MAYAVVNHVRFTDIERATASTRETVLPRLRSLAGFETATFLAEPDGDAGFSVMVFASREQAEEMAARLAGGHVPEREGITFQGQTLYEVVASA